MTKRPNFLIIVADDLGYSDIGPFGGEIETPNLDRIAREGIRLTNFHTASACSPTRAMLMSGTDNHISGLGQMAEYMKPREVYEGKPGYEGYLNWKVAAMPEILQDAGYYTMISGKWHLGLHKETAPCSRGFTKVHTFLPGSGNHYNFEPQDATELPLETFVKSDGWWMQGDQYIDRRSDLPHNFYSTSTFTDNLLGFLDERKADPEAMTKPFFAYLPFTAPHWPLQAPREIINKYKGCYDDGPEGLRERRIRRMKELGIIGPEVESAPWSGIPEKDWAQLSDQERRISARKMEVFSAMVDMIDQNIGRVLDHLESQGELDNTFILFMSDNGAEGTLLEAFPVMGTNIGAIIEKYYDNSLDNIGNKDSFVWYGSRWACASMAPSRGFKTWTTEGGIRCPCIIRYPLFATDKSAITDSFATVMDILPTVLELAGIPAPVGRFRGRDIVPLRGISWVRHLKAKPVGSTTIHDEDEAITGWELFGNRAIRWGKFKAVLLPPPRGSGDWELYNIEMDPAEIHDIASKEPELMKRMITHWETYYTETGMFQIPGDFQINNA